MPVSPSSPAQPEPPFCESCEETAELVLPCLEVSLSGGGWVIHACPSCVRSDPQLAARVPLALVAALA
ncbi:hypothetical protein FH609_027105 [Streptomyces sp. 3MP-14]|uniref:Uncharacterized protein n=1 Tax=Streptomyces mimosae TaxID=2586635 RepID=A0A5N5ZZP5_9ACTN|nr:MULTISPECIES: hypothetical protein [Streptomyces]KAB8161402.1 hypothetical protein FH607_025290 [Streptomyces mimosae]KAB8173274.1 hypothetical protein FH609_027105 [Streptomyces sp. 3MP-14]